MTNTENGFWDALRQAKKALASAAAVAETERDFDAVTALLDKLVLTEKLMVR